MHMTHLYVSVLIKLFFRLLARHRSSETCGVRATCCLVLLIHDGNLLMYEVLGVGLDWVISLRSTRLGCAMALPVLMAGAKGMHNGQTEEVRHGP